MGYLMQRIAAPSFLSIDIHALVEKHFHDLLVTAEGC